MQIVGDIVLPYMVISIKYGTVKFVNNIYFDHYKVVTCHLGQTLSRTLSLFLIQI